jgi:hypothetical protein
MKRPGTVSVLVVGTVSCIFHGTLAVVFAPILSMLMLFFGALPAPFHTALTAEHGMVLTLVAPFVCGASGFVIGALMAVLFNSFASMLFWTRPPAKTVVEPCLQVEGASVGKAAA